MIKPYPLKFIPIYKERIWGGHTLKSWFNYDGKEPIGEYWVLSAHPGDMSKVLNGELEGMTIQELTTLYPEYYLGDSLQKRFPLLIKFLDIAQDLSVQVHPDDDYAQKYEGDFGKTECWYILSTQQDGEVIYGHHFNDKKEYYKAVKDKKINYYLNYLPIKPQQITLVPSGTLHALLRDTILIEVQQTSDVTYRVYDWDRLDDNGNARELHIDKAADVLNYKSSIPSHIQESELVYKNAFVMHEKLIQCSYFTIEKVIITTGTYTLFLGEHNPDILVIAKGEGFLKSEDLLLLHMGDVILCPKQTNHLYQITTNSELHILRIYYL